MVWFRRVFEAIFGSAASLLAILLLASTLQGESIPVKHKEGTIRGFLALSDANGKRIGDGDLMEISTGDTVTARMIIRFHDGSLDDERTVFSQRGNFKLVHDHHVQKGPSFPHPLDVDIDVPSQKVITKLENEGKVETDQMDLPDDLANGLPLTLVKNIKPHTAELKVSYLASTPKPRLVHLAISDGIASKFSVGRQQYKATCFLFHVELGGITGVLAPLIGKEPADSRVWVVEQGAPSFVRAELPLYDGGPLWTIQMTSPVWGK